MIVLVGLGNPGEKYRNSRHNAGFMVIDKLTQISSASWRIKTQSYNSNLKSEIIELTFKEDKVILVKPHTFMNNSGVAVKKIMQLNHLIMKQSNNLYVIHDDLDLPLGRLKIVKNRSSAGHKGVESIIAALGTQDFVRFRIGTEEIKKSEIKKLKNRQDYVLGEFKGEGKKLFELAIERCAEAILYALDHGLEKAAGKYNVNFP